MNNYYWSLLFSVIGLIGLIMGTKPKNKAHLALYTGAIITCILLIILTVFKIF